MRDVIEVVGEEDGIDLPPAFSRAVDDKSQVRLAFVQLRGELAPGEGEAPPELILIASGDDGFDAQFAVDNRFACLLHHYAKGFSLLAMIDVAYPEVILSFARDD